MSKCRGCGEHVDQWNPYLERQHIVGGPGDMHIGCEVRRLNVLVEEARKMEKLTTITLDRLNEEIERYCDALKMIASAGMKKLADDEAERRELWIMLTARRALEGK